MQAKLLKYIPGAIMVLVITLLSVGGILLVRNWVLNTPDQAPTRIQIVTLMMPPPPKIEEKIEPVKQEEVKIDEIEEPLPTPDDQPSPGELGTDEDGAGAGDGFGILGRKGGRGLLDGNPYGWYTSQMQKAIYDALYENQKIRKKRYTIIVSIWLEGSGKIKKIELQNSSGDKEIDKEINTTLKTLSAMMESPPDQMPQPINLRIASRG
jgi:periplasmic protein TonB